MKNFSNHLIIISLFTANVLFAFQTPLSFTKKDFGFRGSSYGATEFGDFDADGDLDLLVIGEEDIGVRVGVVYLNGSGTFNSESLITLPIEFINGDAKWGDYDNDGDLDIFVAGGASGGKTRIFRNDSGSFTELTFSFFNLEDTAVDWGDYDNDGDLDAVVTGRVSADRYLYIYENRDGTFVDSGIQLDGVRQCDIEFVDYDNDGDLDLFVTGSQSSGRSTILYRNDEGSFVDSGIEFVAMLDAASDFGDYDADGDLDLIISGNGNDDGTLEPRTIIYNNDITTFTRQSFTPTHLEQGDVKWADFDNDGDLDFIQSGRTQDGSFLVETYQKTQTNFVLNQQGITDSVRNTAISIGDYDNDGDLDFAISGRDDDGRYTVIYSNNAGSGNLRPVEPGTISTNVDGNSVQLSWGMGSDNETPAQGLTYNLKLGTNREADNKMTAHNTNEGSYMLSRRGNMESGLSKSITHLLPGTYYWGVQSVDNNFNTSNFVTDTFVIEGVEPSIEITAPMLANTLIGGEPFTITWNSTAVQEVDIEFSSNGGVSWSLVEKNVAATQGNYQWAVPEVQSVTAKIRLTATENTAIQVTSSLFAITSRFVLIQQPNGGEVFKPDSTIFIDFITPYTSDFKVEYSTDNGGNWSEITVVNETFGESSEPWTIPDIQSTECRVRVTDINHPTVSDISDGTFSIVNEGAKYLSIISPKGGEKWEAGSVPTIFWEQNNVVNIKIEVSFDDGATYGTLTESTPASEGWYTWQLPNFVAENCFVRITDVDDESVTDVSESSFAITDTTGPVFDASEGYIDITPDVDVGFKDTVSVKVVDNTEIQEVRLYYKTAGTFDSYLERIMIPDDEEYEWILDPAPQLGYRLFAEAEDIHGNTSRTDTSGTTVKIGDEFENQEENVGGSSVAEYVLFSVPVNLNDKSPATFLVINNFDDTPDPQDYRFYSYQNGSADIFIEYNKNGFGAMEPGRGFFLLSNDDFYMIAGEGVTINPGTNFVIPGLQQGWNLIGSPFPYPIPYSNVFAVEQGSSTKVNFSLWEYDGGWQHVQGGNLQPWKGYALQLDNDADFVIPPDRQSFGKISPTFTTLNNNNDEWMIRIKAQNGKSKSDFNFVGQSFDASNGLDRLDLNAPPRLQKQVAISFKNENKARIVTDIRESNNIGHTWDFVCYTNPKEEKLSLSFSGVSNFSADKDIFLIDENSRTSYNLKNSNNLQFAAKGIASKNFKIAVGTKEYLEGLNLETELYPTNFSLKQNFPNPFNPSTQISFTIKAAGPVNLTIYDLLGQQVAVLINDNLEPGNYSSVWDASGQSSGIYFIRLTSGKNVAIKRAIFIK